MTDVGYILSVKHATKDIWFDVGPDPRRWGFFQLKDSVDAMAVLFKSLGLETKIKEIPVTYDDRG